MMPDLDQMSAYPGTIHNVEKSLKGLREPRGPI